MAKVKNLLTKGADVNSKLEDFGATVQIVASQEGHIGIVKTL